MMILYFLIYIIKDYNAHVINISESNHISNIVTVHLIEIITKDFYVGNSISFCNIEAKSVTSIKNVIFFIFKSFSFL